MVRMTTPYERMARMRESFEKKNKSVLTEDYKYFTTPDKTAKQRSQRRDLVNVSQPDKHDTTDRHSTAAVWLHRCATSQFSSWPCKRVKLPRHAAARCSIRYVARTFGMCWVCSQTHSATGSRFIK